MLCGQGGGGRRRVFGWPAWWPWLGMMYFACPHRQVCLADRVPIAIVPSFHRSIVPSPSLPSPFGSNRPWKDAGRPRMAFWVASFADGAYRPKTPQGRPIVSLPAADFLRERLGCSSLSSRGHCHMYGWCQGCHEWSDVLFVCSKCLGMFCYIRCKYPEDFICKGCFWDLAFQSPDSDDEE